MGTLPDRQPGWRCSFTAELTLALVDRINSPGMSLVSPQPSELDTEDCFIESVLLPTHLFCIKLRSGLRARWGLIKTSKIKYERSLKRRAAEGGQCHSALRRLGMLQSWVCLFWSHNRRSDPGWTWRWLEWCLSKVVTGMASSEWCPLVLISLYSSHPCWLWDWTYQQTEACLVLCTAVWKS